MRFELGGEGNRVSINRIEQATFRGTAIFNALMERDETIITMQEWEEEFFDRHNRNKPYIYQLLEGVELKCIKGPFEQTYFEEDEYGVKQEKVFEKPLECDLLIGKANLTPEQVEAIIRGIACREMGESPSIPQDLTLFSLNTQAGFRMYDDRGCDIWANSIEVLRPIYHSLNSWILDYNRPEIDRMFGDNRS